MTTAYQIVLITVPDDKVAGEMAQSLLEKRLAACVNIIPKMRSLYWWEGEIESTEEQLLLVKTRISLMPEILSFVKENHPYSVPEIVSLEISDGNETYLDWIGANCTFAPKADDGKKRTKGEPQ